MTCREWRKLTKEQKQKHLKEYKKEWLALHEKN